MVLNQKCQNKVKSYLCSSAAASAEQEEGTRPDARDSKTSRVSAVNRTPDAFGASCSGAKVEPLRKTNLMSA